MTVKANELRVYLLIYTAQDWTANDDDDKGVFRDKRAMPLVGTDNGY